MKSERSTVIEGLDREEMSRSDMEPTPDHILKTTDEPDDIGQVEVHLRHHPHDRAHVDLMKDEYIPEEVALMLGTSLEVVMHAIWNGELKAGRKGQKVVSISRVALIDWYHRQ
jgi:hypothetical protein